MGAESGVTHLQARGRQGLLAAARSWEGGRERFSLHKETAPPTPGFRPPAPVHWRITVCPFEPPRLCTLIQRPRETKISGGGRDLQKQDKIPVFRGNRGDHQQVTRGYGLGRVVLTLKWGLSR